MITTMSTPMGTHKINYGFFEFDNLFENWLIFENEKKDIVSNEEKINKFIENNEIEYPVILAKCLRKSMTNMLNEKIKN